uniref:CCHC-type domain-containing protein n=1 Tax=Xenopus tropicalis TaxID=8364 RepID=A0A1B8Y1G8_XENTR
MDLIHSLAFESNAIFNYFSGVKTNADLWKVLWDECENFNKEIDGKTFSLNKKQKKIANIMRMIDIYNTLIAQEYSIDAGNTKIEGNKHINCSKVCLEEKAFVPSISKFVEVNQGNCKSEENHVETQLQVNNRLRNSKKPKEPKEKKNKLVYKGILFKGNLVCFKCRKKGHTRRECDTFKARDHSTHSMFPSSPADMLDTSVVAREQIAVGPMKTVKIKHALAEFLGFRNPAP